MNKSILSLIVLVTLAMSVVQAGLDPTNLPTSSYYQGRHSFSEDMGDGVTLTGRVEFAVYRGTEAENAIATTGFEGDTDYVYAYQVFNDQESDAAMTYFAVTGIDPTAVDTDGIGVMKDFDEMGVEPSEYGFSTDQTKGIWVFNDATIIQDEYSWFLFIYSDYDWVAGGMQVQPIYDDDIPVPNDNDDTIPEPMTLLLLGCGGLLALSRRS